MKFEQLLQIYWSRGFLYGGKVGNFNITLKNFFSENSGLADTSKLKIIKGFDTRFENGMCYDDDEFLLTIKEYLKLNVICIPSDNCFVIHQWHPKSASFCIDQTPDDNPIKIKWLRNQKLFEITKHEHL